MDYLDGSIYNGIIFLLIVFGILFIFDIGQYLIVKFIKKIFKNDDPFNKKFDY